jgi:hypothetical protein
MDVDDFMSWLGCCADSWLHPILLQDSQDAAR